MVSVIIPTLNRDEPLCTTLEYFLNRETYKPFEIIVIDQTERHDEVTSRFLEEMAHRFTHVRVNYTSLTRARNHGVRLAQGDIVVFVDDDTEPYAGFLAGHVAPYADERIWAVTGPSPEPGHRLISRDELGRIRYAKLLAGKDICFQADFDYFPCSWAPGCNLSSRKSVINLVGGFDEQFHGVAIGEDAEFCHRVKKAGGCIYYAAAAGLIHRIVSTGGSRDSPTLDYITAYADNINLFWRKIGANWPTRLGANWSAYRRFVLNRHNIKNFSIPTFGALHLAFVSGVMIGLRRTNNDIREG